MLKEKSKSKKRLTINAIQNGIFYMLFILLPFSIIPMPWDWTERGVSILILIIGTAVVFLEILKFVWDGKFSIFKNSVDTGILLILLASVISTVFSVDPELSFWGVDMNLGSGLISLVAVILVCFVMRSFIDTFEEIAKVLMYFSIGVFIINTLSIMSFLDIHFLSSLPAYEGVFTYGLPWTLSAQTLLVLNGVIVITSFGLILWNKQRSKSALIFNIASLIISLVTVLLFSVNQGFPIVLMLVVSMAVLIYLTWRYIRFKGSEEKNFRILVLIPFILLIVFFILLKVPQIKESVIGSPSSLTQVSLGGDMSWKIVSSGISNKFLRALIGYGQSTFVMLYNMYKPGTTEMLVFNSTNFYYGSNEIITNLAEGGILFICAWTALGYFLFKELISQIKNLRKNTTSEKTIIMLTLGISSAFIYVSSISCHFGIILKLVLFVLISLWVVASNIDRLKIPEKFVLRMWAVNTDEKRINNIPSGGQNINIVMTVVLVLGFVTLTSVWCRILLSDIYISSTEQYISEKSSEFKESVPDDVEREEFIEKSLKGYSKAESLIKMNSLVNRKLALLNLEAVSLYAEQYTHSDDQNEKEELLDKISVYRRESVNQAQRAVERSPQFYDGWKAASSTYTGLLSIGLKDYSRDALDALNRASDLNPTNYELYYNAAQVYLSDENTEKALTMLVKVLELNPSHVPSIILAGDINKELGKNEIYISYLNAAKAVMEKYGQTDTDMYKEVIKDIQEAEESAE